ncbi:MAG: multicopper oxidase domain-containing protein [Acidobacteriota bacterium]
MPSVRASVLPLVFPQSSRQLRPAVASVIVCALLAGPAAAEAPPPEARPLFREAPEIAVAPAEEPTLLVAQRCPQDPPPAGEPVDAESVGGGGCLTYVSPPKSGGPLRFNPTIRMKPGHEGRIVLRNDIEPFTLENIKDVTPRIYKGRESKELGEFLARQSGITNLHTHGLHVSPAGRSDNVMLRIEKGRQFEYRYRLPDDHAPGTHWYHAHVHGSTALQVQGGMSGALIVDPPDPSADLNPPGYSIRERILVVRTGSQDEIKPSGAERDRQNGSAPEVLNLKTPEALATRVNELSDRELERLLKEIRDLRVEARPLTVNGDVNPVATVGDTREIQRLRIINAGSRKKDFRSFWIEGHDMILAAFDGINLPKLPTDTHGNFTVYNKCHRLELAPGNRADVFFIPSESGSFALMAAGEVGLDSLMPHGGTASKDGGSDSALQRRRTYEQKLITFRISDRSPEARNGASSPTGQSVDSRKFFSDLNTHLEKLQRTIPAYQTGYLRPFREQPDVVRHLTFAVENPTNRKERVFEINGRSFNPKPRVPITHHDMPGATDYLGNPGRNSGSDGGRGPAPDHRTPWPPRTGTEEEWTIKNTSEIRHPLHIHVSPFWVTGIKEHMCLRESSPQVKRCVLDPDRNDRKDQCTCPSGWEKKLESVRKYFPNDPRLDRWQDTVVIPPYGGSVTFRHRLSDELTGLYVLHCHILQHEDRGMMINILTVPKDHQDPQAFFEEQRAENRRLNQEINGTAFEGH